jgi:hypothetical protein
VPHLSTSKKAVDSIERELMFAILRSYGIPDTTVKAIRVLDNNSRSAVMAEGRIVMAEGRISDTFGITTGVIQRELLSPFLYVILINYLPTTAMTRYQSWHITQVRQSSRNP